MRRARRVRAASTHSAAVTGPQQSQSQGTEAAAQQCSTPPQRPTRRERHRGRWTHRAAGLVQPTSKTAARARARARTRGEGVSKGEGEEQPEVEQSGDEAKDSNEQRPSPAGPTSARFTLQSTSFTIPIAPPETPAADRANATSRHDTTRVDRPLPLFGLPLHGTSLANPSHRAQLSCWTTSDIRPHFNGD